LNPKPYKCTHEGCNEEFAKHGQLRRHVCLHTGKKPYPCTEEGCTSAFDYPSMFKNHIDRVHKGIKKWVCGYENCNQAFAKCNELHKHQKEHIKTFTCNICSETFKKLEYLNNHKNTCHTDKKNLFSCQECGREFTKKYNLKVHIRSNHSEETFDCDMCPKKFKHKHTLQKHKTKHHIQNEENSENTNEKKLPPRKKRKTVDVLLGGIPPRINLHLIDNTQILDTSTPMPTPPLTSTTDKSSTSTTHNTLLDGCSLVNRCDTDMSDEMTQSMENNDDISLDY